MNNQHIINLVEDLGIIQGFDPEYVNVFRNSDTEMLGAMIYWMTDKISLTYYDKEADALTQFGEYLIPSAIIHYENPMLLYIDKVKFSNDKLPFTNDEIMSVDGIVCNVVI